MNHVDKPFNGYVLFMFIEQEHPGVQLVFDKVLDRLNT